MHLNAQFLTSGTATRVKRSRVQDPDNAILIIIFVAYIDPTSKSWRSLDVRGVLKYIAHCSSQLELLGKTGRVPRSAALDSEAEQISIVANLSLFCQEGFNKLNAM